MCNFNLMLYEYAKKYNLNTLTKRKNAFKGLAFISIQANHY